MLMPRDSPAFSLLRMLSNLLFDDLSVHELDQRPLRVAELYLKAIVALLEPTKAAALHLVVEGPPAPNAAHLFREVASVRSAN